MLNLPEQTPGDSEGWEVWHAAVHGVTECRTRLRDETKKKIVLI